MYNLIQKLTKHYSMHHIITIKGEEFSVPATIHSEAMNCMESMITQELFKYDFILRKRESQNYLAFIYDVFTHPNFNSISDAIIHQLFRELSAGFGQPKLLEYYTDWNQFYGILLITFPEKILNYVQFQSAEKLKQSIFELTCNGCARDCIKKLKPMRILLLVRKLKQCRIKDDIWNIGVNYIDSPSLLDGFADFAHEFLIHTIMLIKQKRITKVQDLLYGLCLSKSTYARQNYSLYNRLTLTYYHQKYWMGYKISQTAYKLANGYILQKSFIESDYKMEKEEFIQKFKNWRCDNNNCNAQYRRRTPLKPCVGCMKVLKIFIVRIYIP